MLTIKHTLKVKTLCKRRRRKKRKVLIRSTKTRLYESGLFAMLPMRKIYNTAYESIFSFMLVYILIHTALGRSLISNNLLEYIRCYI